MATIDQGGLRKPAKGIHEGINVAICRISLSVSWSSGDVHRIGKLPHGAVPVGAVFYPGTALPGTAVMKFGSSASQELFFASATYSIATQATRALGPRQQISLSDDFMAPGGRFEAIVMVATAGVSVGYVGDLEVRYVLDYDGQ